MKRTATAAWSGSGKDGNGNLTTQSTTLNKAQYSYKTRFEQGVGTNPEELIAAAHAGCYTMALAFQLQGAGFTADSLETTATINFDSTGQPATITQSALSVKGSVPGISKEKFLELAKVAETGCPVSRVLKCEITMEATLL